MNPRKIELLSPAGNADIAIQAILHGADAVYIGPPSHGARKSASNTISDIEKVVDFAHQYRAKVYATVNTIIYDNEIKEVEELCRNLYHAGVDALIVQDMGILRMKIPPIALHASTQCDIRTPEKALFLQEAGFSQLVLARELSLQEIKAITETVEIPVETFVHGALCVSYSGRCHASYALTGRSANRGECAQICRLPYTLIDSEGKILSKDKYLLSLKDFNASHSLNELLEAGVSSFKIEGRLKEKGYVKNITSLYNNALNKIINEFPDRYIRSSFGKVSLKFNPVADKSFNRGFTDYFLRNRAPLKITSLLTPKSMGEPIHDLSLLNNGDGISFFDSKGNYTGVNINNANSGKITTAKNINVPKDTTIFRTSDVRWNKLMESETSTRKIHLSIEFDERGVTAYDERGVNVRLGLSIQSEPANKPQDYKNIFEKLGNTPFILKKFISHISPDRFYRVSEITDIRRRLTDLLNKANNAVYPFEYRLEENRSFPFPYKNLDYKDNVANKLAVEFYKDHGVETIEKAAECKSNLCKGDVVMTTRHCILRELGLCKKIRENQKDLRFPLYLKFDGGRFRLDFDCKRCEMSVLLDKSNALNLHPRPKS